MQLPCIKDCGSRAQATFVGAIGLFLIGCSCFPTWEASIAASMAFIVCFIWLLFSHPRFILKYALPLFSSLMFLGGVASCEFTSVDLPELGVTSGFVGSLPLALFSQWLFVVGLLVVDGLVSRRLHDCDGPSSVGVLLSVVLDILLLVFMLAVCADLLQRPPAINGVDRFIWRQRFGEGTLFLRFGAALQYAAVIPIVAAFSTRRPWLLAPLFLYVGCLVWTGEKFTGLMGIAYLVILAAYPFVARLDKRKVAASLAIALIGATATVGFAIYSAVHVLNYNPVQYLSERLAQQGQLWWRTFDLTDGAAHIGDIESEVRAVTHGESTAPKDNIGSDVGIYRIMYYSSQDTERVNRKLSLNSRYTEGGIAAAYYYGGQWGVVVFEIAMASLFAILINLLIRAIRLAELVEAVLFYRFWNVASVARSMGLYADFFDSQSLLSYVSIAALAMAHRSTWLQLHCHSLLLKAEELAAIVIKDGRTASKNAALSDYPKSCDSENANAQDPSREPKRLKGIDKNSHNKNEG